MSKIILIILLFAFAICKVDVVASGKQRGILNEEVVFEVVVRGACREYDTILSTIQISRFRSPNCLPIQLSATKPNNDTNDRHAHVLCTDRADGSSIFRFVEIFQSDEHETPAPGDTFIVSWVNNFPFVERSRRYTYKKRPTCSVKTDECSLTQIVKGCTDNNVILQNGFVNDGDRIYFIPPNTDVSTCTINSACCPYVSTSPDAICGGSVEPLCPNTDPCVILTYNATTMACDSRFKCEDNNPCTNDTCNATTGQCSNIPKCEDNNPCTNDTCNATTGQCSNVPKCEDNNPCTNDTCNATTGQCSNIPKCNDGNLCTNDVCTAGTCTYPQKCDDSLLCTNDTCDPATGNCTHVEKCDDGNVCTTDICNPNNGSCLYINACYDARACSSDICTPINSTTFTCSRTYACKLGGSNCYYCREVDALCKVVPDPITDSVLPIGNDLYDLSKYCQLDLQSFTVQQFTPIITAGGYCFNTPKVTPCPQGNDTLFEVLNQ